MYQKNLKSYYNRHYGRAKPGELDSPSKMLNNKRMLEEDSEDEFTVNNKLRDEEQKLNEKKLARLMFIVTAFILLVQAIKYASESSFDSIAYIVNISDVFCCQTAVTSPRVRWNFVPNHFYL